MAHNAHILRRIARSNATRTHLNDEIEHPTDAGFATPVTTHQRMHLVRWMHLVPQIGAVVVRPLAVRFRQRDTSQLVPPVARV